jgi:hypothetical protein
MLLTISARALADVPGLALTWTAPEGCPPTAEVERTIERLLGARPANSVARPIEARVAVERTRAGRYQAEVVTSGSSTGSRHLEGESCSAVALATAVVIALAIDSSAKQNVPAEPTERAAPPAALVSPSEPVVFFAHAFGGAVLRALPGLSASFGLGAGLQRRPWETELMVAYAPAHGVQVSRPTEAGARIDLLSVSGLGCYAAVASPAAAFDLCLGAQVEKIAADATLVTDPGRGYVVLFSPVATMRSETRLASRLALVLDVSAVVRPFHPQFVIGGVGGIYAIPVIGGSLAGGLQLAF